MNVSPLLLFLTSFFFIVIPKQIYYYEIFKKIQLSVLKILIIQETRNLLSPTFILVREKKYINNIFYEFSQFIFRQTQDINVLFRFISQF